MAWLFRSGDQRSVARDFIVLDRLSRCHDRRIQNLLILHLARDVISFSDEAIDSRTFDALRRFAELFENLVKPLGQSLSTARPGLEVIITNSRQLFDESYDGPDLAVGYFNGAKTRHAGHIDSVLDHPEQLLWRALVGYFFKIGRVRI